LALYFDQKYKYKDFGFQYLKADGILFEIKDRKIRVADIAEFAVTDIEYMIFGTTQITE
jgi:hypothetical protein